MATNIKQEYEQDFYAWTLHNARLLREGKLSEIDIENLAEEVEGMGRSDKRELVSRFVVLLAHLLKWQYQPDRQGKSWVFTIKQQRLAIKQRLEKSPSLKYQIEKTLADAYEEAVLRAAIETDLDENAFPTVCPFTFEESMNPEFLPDNYMRG